MSEFHVVSKEELQTVHQWLRGHLPDSWEVFGMTREALRGRWKGQIFYTLGWPVIRAVMTGGLDPDSPASGFVEHCQRKSVYAENPNDVRLILTSPFYVDWTKNFDIMFTNDHTTSVIQTLAKELGHKELTVNPLVVHWAEPGDIQPRPIPQGFTLRQLDPTREAEFCLSVWGDQTPGALGYLKTLMQHLPNLCLADSTNDVCVCSEMGTECGEIRWLYTREEYRGRGLAKVVTSQLAHKFFQDRLPCVVLVAADNEVSLKLHLSLGFKKICTANFMYHRPGVS